MSEQRSGMDRRDFLRHGIAGASVAALGRSPGAALRGPRVLERPIVITSHTNDTGRAALEEAWTVLSGRGTALDAVERATNIIEVDPEDTSVGYGGLPNADGVVELDASVMDGRTYSAGSVASIRNIKTPCSVARLVMERTDHVMLVGEGALRFAREHGFQEEDLLTPRAREAWLRWRENLSDRDDYGPPDHIRNVTPPRPPEREEFHYGTVNVLAVDANGDIAGITSTSGLSWKVPGRIGDSPIIGAGLYVDNAVGAAGVTGRGEDVIKSCASFFIVMRMREGRTPQQACDDAAEFIVSRYRAVGNSYTPGEKFVAINKDGEVGCARLASNSAATMTVRTASGSTTFTGSRLYAPGE
jgi:N4-(beta-N-acetylglucosaminyl)-L-asparaginase